MRKGFHGLNPILIKEKFIQKRGVNGIDAFHLKKSGSKNWRLVNITPNVPAHILDGMSDFFDSVGAKITEF